MVSKLWQSVAAGDVTVVIWREYKRGLPFTNCQKYSNPSSMSCAFLGLAPLKHPPKVMLSDNKCSYFHSKVSSFMLYLGNHSKCHEEVFSL